MSTAPARAAAPLAPARPAPVRPSTRTVYRWELRKLRSQKRTYLGLFAAVFVPVAFTTAFAVRGRGPDDVAFGRYVNQTGLAVPLVALLFGSAVLYPLIGALVAGDIVASEDNNGTLKTILTRSVSRGQVFAAKALAAGTYIAAALLLSATAAVIAGGLNAGLGPLTTLSGTHVSTGRGLVLIAGAVGVYLLPLLALCSIGVLLSTVTKNSAASIVGTLVVSLLLELLAILPGLGALRPYLLPREFDAWQGLLRSPIDWAPIVRAAWVSALYAGPALFAGYTAFLRRDVAGG